MTVTHPAALRDAGVPGGYTFGTTTYAVDSDGVIDCPADLEAEIAEALAAHYGMDVAAVLETETGGGTVPEHTRDADDGDAEDESDGDDDLMDFHDED